MKIKNLTFQYENTEENLFTHLNWEIPEGTVNILLGPNGSGKTTLLDIISRLIDTSPDTVTGIDQTDIVYQIQGVPILRTIKGKHFVELLLRADKKWSHKMISQNVFNGLTVQEQHKLDQLWEKEYGFMSPGERRWLTIQCYCQYDRKLYIFDEPTVGVDALNQRLIIERIDQLVKTKERTVLLTTHIANELNFFSRPNLHLIENGKITNLGDLETCQYDLDANREMHPFLDDFFTGFHLKSENELGFTNNN